MKNDFIMNITFDDALANNILFCWEKYKHNKFNITKDDINLLRSLAPKKIKNPHKILVLLESGDEILDYKMTISYFRGANIDIFLGGDHSYSSFELKLEKIKKFINS